MNIASKPPLCEIVTIGTEILLGHIQDTNTTYLARELGQIGISIKYRTSVGDNLEEIVCILESALRRSDFVIATGGLGPTLDDLTREAVAGLGNVALDYRPELMDQIERRFKKAGYHMPVNNRRQAFLPAGSIPVSNPVGTAPAFIFEEDDKPIICLPGVPRELEYLLQNAIIPWLKQRYCLDQHVLKTKILKSVGMGESRVDDLIGDLMGEGKNPEVGLLASMGEIKVRITAKANDEKEAERLIRPVETDVRERLGGHIYGQDDDTLEAVIERLLIEKEKRLAIVETFTGAKVAGRFCQLPSTRLTESLIIPDKIQFARWLGKNETVGGQETAVAAARKIREQSRAQTGLAVVGFPQPSETLLKVDAHICVVDQEGEQFIRWQMGADLFNLQLRGAVMALNALRTALL